RATEARWYLAKHDDPDMSGLALGLVDGIATERAAFAALHQSLNTSGAPAAGAAITTEEEADMSLADQIAALRSRAARGDAAARRQLKSLGVRLRGEKGDDPESETDEDDREAETEDDPEAETEDEDAEGDDEDPEAETEDEEAEDDEEEPAAHATGTKAGFALLGCAEARERDGLARELGRKVGAK